MTLSAKDRQEINRHLMEERRKLEEAVLDARSFARNVRSALHLPEHLDDAIVLEVLRMNMKLLLVLRDKKAT